MSKLLWFIPLILLLPVKTCAQSVGLHTDTILARELLKAAYRLKDQQDTAYQLAAQSVEIYQRYCGGECLPVAEAYHLMAVMQAVKGAMEAAIELSQDALRIARKGLVEDNILISNILLNLGTWHVGIDIETSLRYSEECLSVRKRIYGEIHKEVATTYLNLASAYWESGDLFKAADYNLKALSILEQIPDKDSLGIASAKVGLANIYAEQGQYDLVNRLYEEALDLRVVKLGPDAPMVARTYSNWGSWYLEQKRFDEAIACQLEALRIRRKVLPPDHVDMATSYNNLGLALDAIGAFDSAIVFLRKAIEIREKKLAPNHPRIGSTWFNLGTCYAHSGAYAQAVDHYQKALGIQLANVQSVGPDVMNTLEALVQALIHSNRAGEIPELLNSLQLAGGTLLYPNSLRRKVQLFQFKGRYLSDVTDLSGPQAEYALVPFEEMDALLSSDQYLAWPGDLREYFMTYIFTGYFSGASACANAWYKTGNQTYLDRAFKYAEKSKSFLLYGKLRDESAKLKAGIPDSLLQRERHLYRRLGLFQRRLDDEKEKGTAGNDSLSAIWTLKVVDLKDSVAVFRKILEEQYPKYFRLKYDQTAVSLAYLQDTLLHRGEAILEYFTGDSLIWVFLIRSDSCSLAGIPKDFPLESWVNALHTTVSGYGALRNGSDQGQIQSVARYIEIADSLYQKLLAPFASRLPERVIIIPDGVLGYVPFEALLEKRPENPYYYSSFAWFGKKHVVSYCYSGTLLREMRNKIHQKAPTLGFLGLAPYFNGDTTLLAGLFGDDFSVRKDLKPLPNSGKEVYGIRKIMGGAAYYGPDATEARFLKEAGKARVIHLATHARADSRVGDYAWLAFNEIRDSLENELLFVRDLYNLSLNADLVVLSACETALGLMKKGEGMLSLARAFAYAGAKSILTTLWNVNDARTAEIMLSFYQHYKKGMPAARALWQAKNDYIAGKDGDWAHPYFWAGFIGIGF